MSLRRVACAAVLGVWPAVVPAADGSLLLHAGPGRSERLVAAAKREGSLTLYTTFAEKDLPGLVGPFEKKYGIKVNVWRAGSNAVLQRTLRETAARRFEVDAIHFGAPELEALHREKILQPVASPHFASLMPGAVPAHREWVATLLSVWVQAYNTNLVRKEDLPRTWRDLLDPKWKGKLAVEARDQDWFATVVRDMGEAQGLEFFRELAARNGVSARQGHTLLNNLVASGEVPVALNVYSYMPEQAKRKGAPIGWIAIEPAVARANGIGIARRAPHPNAAALFYDYMISEAQPSLVEIGHVPVRADLPSPLGNLRLSLVDPKAALDEWEKWAKLYEQVVTRRGGS
jgi:iron(III) transport system substrate-binding protein